MGVFSTFILLLQLFPLLTAYSEEEVGNAIGTSIWDGKIIKAVYRCSQHKKHMFTPVNAEKCQISWNSVTPAAVNYCELKLKLPDNVIYEHESLKNFLEEFQKEGKNLYVTDPKLLHKISACHVQQAGLSEKECTGVLETMEKAIQENQEEIDAFQKLKSTKDENIKSTALHCIARKGVHRQKFLTALVDTYLDNVHGKVDVGLFTSYKGNCHLSLLPIFETVNQYDLKMKISGIDTNFGKNEFFGNETVEEIVKIMRKDEIDFYVKDAAQIFLMPICRTITSLKAETISKNLGNQLAEVYLKKKCNFDLPIDTLFTEKEVKRETKMAINKFNMMTSIANCPELEIKKSDVFGDDVSGKEELLRNRRLQLMLQRMNSDHAFLIVDDADSSEAIQAAIERQKFVNAVAEILLDSTETFLIECNLKKESLFKKNEINEIIINIDVLESVKMCNAKLATMSKVPLSMIEYIRKEMNNMDSVSGDEITKEEFIDILEFLHKSPGKLQVTQADLIERIPIPTMKKPVEVIHKSKAESTSTSRDPIIQYRIRKLVNDFADTLLDTKFDKACVKNKESLFNVENQHGGRGIFINLVELVKMKGNPKCNFVMTMSGFIYNFILAKELQDSTMHKVKRDEAILVLEKLKEKKYSMQVTQLEAIKSILQLIEDESKKPKVHEDESKKPKVHEDKEPDLPLTTDQKNIVINAVAKMLAESTGCEHKRAGLFDAVGGQKEIFSINLDMLKEKIQNKECTFHMPGFQLKNILSMNGKKCYENCENVMTKLNEIFAILENMKKQGIKLEVAVETLNSEISSLKRSKSFGNDEAILNPSNLEPNKVELNSPKPKELGTAKSLHTLDVIGQHVGDGENSQGLEASRLAKPAVDLNQLNPYEL